MRLPLASDPIANERHRARLESYDKPAILLSKEYRILAANTAYQAHYGQQVREGKDRCFEVSHGYGSPCDENGEKCPMQQGLRSRRSERVFHIHLGPDGEEHVDVTLHPLLGDAGEIEAFIEVISPIEQASPEARGPFIGRSPAFVRALELIQRVASSEVPVLLLGESGTGKELAARAIHEASPRRGAPFVPVECSGLGEALFESELFGHARGSFTGAHQRKAGLVEAAAGGTLFLDEIGDVPAGLQVKLLRLIESSSYRPVGDTVARQADFRLVCATHRDLPKMLDEERFRKDLYYRINAFPISLPALRERPEDLVLLSQGILAASGKTLSAEALATLLRHSFPGNIRELKNLLGRAALLSDGPEIQAAHLPPTLVGAPGRSEGGAGGWPWGERVLPLAEVERRYLEWVESHSKGDRKEMARQLGLSERTLYRKLKTLH